MVFSPTPETNDLICEGIATHTSRSPLRLGGLETNDLICEGIATLRRALIIGRPEGRPETNDLICEGIATILLFGELHCLDVIRNKRPDL